MGIYFALILVVTAAFGAGLNGLFVGAALGLGVHVVDEVLGVHVFHHFGPVIFVLARRLLDAVRVELKSVASEGLPVEFRKVELEMVDVLDVLLAVGVKAHRLHLGLGVGEAASASEEGRVALLLLEYE